MSKYIVTDKIYTLDELYSQKFISHRGKVLSKGWFGSWQLRYSHGQLSQGQIYKVKLKEKIKMKKRYTLFIHDDIPFIVLSKRGDALNLKLGNSKQKVFFPVSLTENINGVYKLKDGIDIRWFLNKTNTKNNIESYKKEKIK